MPGNAVAAIIFKDLSYDVREHACNGNGYDDTFAILTVPISVSQKWKIMTEKLGRTFKDTKFADNAIDHIAVADATVAEFMEPQVSADSFGSDHFPISITWTGAP